MSDDDRLSAYLDGQLDPDEQGRVGALLATDPAWVQSLDELRETRALVRGLAAAEPPAGFLESLLELEEPADATVTNIGTARRRRGRVTSAFAGIAAAAALLIAVVVPSVAQTRPALATDVRVHQAGAAASGDPVSELAPIATTMKFSR